MTFRATSYDAIDPGVYDATLDGIEEGTNEFGGFRKWKFTVRTADGEQTLSAMTSDASGPKAKAYKWASVLLGHKPTGEDEKLAGLLCRLHLIVNDEGFNRVEAILPPDAGGSTVNLERLDKQVFDEPAAKQVEVPF